MRIPILKGPLRGGRWLLTSPGQTGRVLTGSYEPVHTALFMRHVAQGQTVFDVGSHAGYYALLFARLVGNTGRVVAFEPHPRNCKYLRRHLHINGCDEVKVVEAAVADVEGTERFAPGRGSGTGALAARGGLQVETVTLDGVCRREGLRPAFIKMDVEGAESRALQGAAEILAEIRPVIALSTHGPAVHTECLALLRRAGYELTSITGDAVDDTSEILAVPN